jgi:thioesterase domain-containing protein
LAAKLKKHSWKSCWSSLVPIHSGGSKKPLFLIHGAEGNVLLYRELANYLGEEQPVYGLQAQGLDGQARVITSIEDMASHYIKEIESLQPEGPYQLGGYCLGGLIAFEMARQLLSRGQKVGFLALLETYNFNSSKDFPRYYGLIYKIQNWKFHLENLMSLNTNDKKKYFSKKLKTEYQRMKMSMEIGLSNKLKFLKRKFNLHYYHLPISEVNHKAEYLYEPKVYQGRVILFRPKKFFAGLDNPLFGWKGLAAQGIEVRLLPFNPRAMLVEPFVKKLAFEISTCLEKSLEKAISNE